MTCSVLYVVVVLCMLEVLEVMRHVQMVVDCMLEVLEGVHCVLLCMLEMLEVEAMESVLHVLEVVKGMRRVL
jgi:hypothetical protein